MATGWPAKHDPSHWPLHYYWGLCDGQKKTMFFNENFCLLNEGKFLFLVLNGWTSQSVVKRGEGVKIRGDKLPLPLEKI